MKSIAALVVAAACLTTSCGAQTPVDSGAEASAAGAVEASDDQELDCSSDQLEELIADFGNDPDGGYETPEIALRRHKEHQSRGDDWPSSEDFKAQERHDSESDFVIFDYLEEDRRLAVVWARDLGRSWLVTAHAICKDVFGH